MAENRNRAPLLPVSGVVFVLAALGVSVFVQPIGGTRPHVPEYQESCQKISARLWQDPFQAVLNGVKGPASPGPSGRFDIAGESPNRRAEKPFGMGPIRSVTVLGMMVPGQSYFEDTETRRRLRYALLSGLERVGFTPDDPEHIGFIEAARSRVPTFFSILPFEWVTHLKSNERVLVVWMNETLFEKRPLSKLARLTRYFRRSNAKISLKVIGPATSSTLKEMLAELSDSETQRKLRAVWANNKMEIYSALATIDNSGLWPDYEGMEFKDKEKLAGGEIARKFEGGNISFERTIPATDGYLARALIKELRLRQVIPNHDVLLVAEWDTDYGRTIGKVFRQAFEEAAKENGWQRRVVSYPVSYIRGIDGVLPGDGEEKKEKKEDRERKGETAEGNNDANRDVKKLEKPTGKSEYDYMRRVAEEMRYLKKDSQSQGAEIGAIGVMGSDFYDKYLVLQAFRQQFPDAVFFTTDLDARFVHPDYGKWTRNVVVASNFGLALRREPHADIQREIPPFRDSSQTSVFSTVLRAFWNDLEPEEVRSLYRPGNGTKGPETNERAGEPEPLVFEIGRTVPVMLTDHPDRIHPQRPDHVFSRNLFNEKPDDRLWKKMGRYVLPKTGTVAGMILLASVFAFFTSSHCNKCLRKNEWKSGRLIIGLVAFFCVGFAAMVYMVSHWAGEEPFSILEGISIWPTEILRFTALLLTVVFILVSQKRRKENIERIEKDFFGGPVDSGARRGRKQSMFWFDWPGGGDLKRMWANYVHEDSRWYRIWRVSIASALFLLFCWAIIALGNYPLAPARGRVSLTVDTILLILGGIALIVLITYVFDVTRCCRSFIANASKKLCEDKLSFDGRNSEQINNQLSLLRLIAARTEAIEKIAFFPWIVWLIIFIGRLEYFDNWSMPFPLLVTVFLGAFYAWSSAFLLRSSAEKARTRVLDRLKELSFTALEEGPGGLSKITYIQRVASEVRSFKQGAFAPFTQHAAVQSLLVPFGGVGGAYLLEFLTKMSL